MLKDIIYSNYVKCVLSFMFICQGSQALASLDCTFEEGFCNWMQDKTDAFNWTRRSGGTPSWLTGPSSDHTTGDGYYIFIEADGQKNGDTARLISPRQKPARYCLNFWYNMYGWYIGTLNVYTKSQNGDEHVIFSRKGNTGTNDWRNVLVDVNILDTFKIVIEGTRGGGNSGDISIDDVSITKGTCSDCDFDKGFCHWTQSNSDDFDWTLQQGPTPSANTDPLSDHTSGNGNYIYIESNNQRREAVALLFSPLQQAGKYCFSFWYHMYGEHVDRLRIALWYINDTGQVMFRKAGNQGSNWIPGNVILMSTTHFWVILEGRIKNATEHDKGDIAVDDIVMASCKGCDNPTPNNAIANSTNFEFGSVIEITCNTGYNLTGDAQMVCQAGGVWSSSRPVCEPYDCKDRSIPNGIFITLNGTTFGQTASQVCKTGFTLYGDTTVTCTSTGWNGTVGTCTIIDCGNRTLDNGQFSTPNGTTFGKTATHVCNIGYTLIGNKNVTCTDSGWKSITGTCTFEDADNGALITVYVLVPVIVIILAVLLTIIYIRRRFPNCKKATESKHESRKNPVMAAANKTYNGLALESQKHINRAYEDGSLDGNVEYAAVSDEQNVNSNKHYYNIGAPGGTSTEHDVHNYDHTNDTATHFVDESYSHISGNKSGMTLEPIYNTTKYINSGKASLRTQAQSDTNSYDLLSIKNSKETAKHRKELDGKESDYDHAHAAVIDPVAKENDDYSHLTDVNIKQKYPASFGSGNDDGIEYSYTNAHSARKGKDVEKSKVGYE